MDKYRNSVVPWGPVGYVVYKRTYARLIENDGREEWWQTVKRCVKAIDEIGSFTQDEIEELYDHVFNLRACFSGRALWQLGTSTVERFGGDSLINCWAVAVNNPVTSFCFAFDELMLGGGVGFNIQPQYVYELPPIKFNPRINRVDTFDCGFIVPDNREGWVKLLGKVLKRFFYGGGDLTYSTNCIRARGKEIKSFGGTASGSESLVDGIHKIINILRACYGTKLRPINCLDIMNIIGSIVVSGNVRRSAEIALGDVNDYEFINAKNWSMGTIPTWRAMSNNSLVCCDPNDLPPEFWSGFNGEGEALGLVNLCAARDYGRIADGFGYRPDRGVIGFNPCAEIPLESYEGCNLCEIFLPNIETQEQFIRIAKIMYKVCKSVTQLPFIHKMSAEIMKQNQRIGISVTGFMQSHFRYDIEVFNNVYEVLEHMDKEYSQYLGSNESIKLTTVKPSGTLSLLPGVLPGVHAAYSPYYIRRVRMAASDPLVKMCRDAGYFVEPQMNQDGGRDYETSVISFPIKTPDDAICAEEMSAIDQLRAQQWLQTYWADNSVSATIYYDDSEVPAIKDWLNRHYHNIKSVSFLLREEHGFLQAPIEPITSEQYKELTSKIIPIVQIKQDSFDGQLQDDSECLKGGCPIK
jgi:hypothetical protein